MLRREHNQRIQATAQPEVITASATSSTEAGALQPGSTEGAQPQATGTVDVVMAAPVVEPPKQPWDMAEELINLLKTGHPLLALTLEQLAEQIRERLKPANEEEIYRVTGGLLSEALHVRIFY
jgi:transformation/transcription domain-associated protein